MYICICVYSAGQLLRTYCGKKSGFVVPVGRSKCKA